MSWWSLIKVGVDGGINNMNQQHQGDVQSQQSLAQNRDNKMKYAEADQKWQGNGIHLSDNVGHMFGMADGTVDQNPLMSHPGTAEKNAGNAPTAIGGYSLQPSQVDSSKPQYENSGLKQYLNYMNYRGRY